MNFRWLVIASLLAMGGPGSASAVVASVQGNAGLEIYLSGITDLEGNPLPGSPHDYVFEQVSYVDGDFGDYLEEESWEFSEQWIDALWHNVSDQDVLATITYSFSLWASAVSTPDMDAAAEAHYRIGTEILGSVYSTGTPVSLHDSLSFTILLLAGDGFWTEAEYGTWGRLKERPVPLVANPIPPAAPLLLGGLAALAWVGRRAKA